MKVDQEKLRSLRKDYSGEVLNVNNVDKDPFIQFGNWFHTVVEKDPANANVMVLATADTTGMPSARVVLLKEFNAHGFVFYTNYNSKKGKEINTNPQGSILFYWPELHRQIRIEGTLEKNEPGTGEKYFNERPRESRVSAWVSPQSQVIESKEMLEEKYVEFSEKYKETTIPYPAFWGGYILKPSLFEFWQGQPNRLHDRVQYRLNVETSAWLREQLAP